MKTFRIGGFHGKDYKLTRDKAIETMPVPEKAVIFLSQHIGAPATCLVAKGDTVKVGTVIGQAGGFVSANIHSSVSGTVVSVDPVADGSGIKKPAVTIQTEGDVWEDSIDRSEDLVAECALEPKEIIAKIASAGIVGMGGATFPTQVKLSVPPGCKAECLIVNGVECEPFLTADHRLMLEKPDQIIAGCRIVMKALGVEKCYIGIEVNKKDAICLLSSKCSGGIEVVPLKLRYPQGGEKQLIDAVIGKQVPSGGLPIATGAVVQNIGTINAIYEAVQKNKPLFERVVTVTGKKVSNPKNVLARIGTPISQLIDFAGGEPEDTAKVVNGGPMMGRAMSNIDAPVTKGTSGVLMLQAKDTVREHEQSCISCAKCVSVCPMGLEPYLLYKLSTRRMFAEMESEKVTDCIECGCCSFTCPAYLPLLDYVRIGKAETMKIIKSRQVKNQ